MSKPSWTRVLGWRLEQAGFVLFTALMQRLPVDAVSDAGAAFGRWFGPLTSSHRVADANIRLAFPELGAAERAALLRAQWDNLGRTFFEFPISHRLTPESGRVEIVGRERLEAIARSGQATVIVAGHFANWEVMSYAFIAAGLEVVVTYRAANNPYVDRMIREERARRGVNLFAPKGGDGSRELLDKLKQGATVALMNDQKFNGGVAAPFFGRTVHTAAGPTRLALRFDAPIQPMTVERVSGARFRVVAHEPMLLEHTGKRERDLEAGVRRINAFIEDRVRARPAEWFWVHRRWPAATYAELKGDQPSSAHPGESRGPSLAETAAREAAGEALDSSGDGPRLPPG